MSKKWNLIKENSREIELKNPLSEQEILRLFGRFSQKENFYIQMHFNPNLAQRINKLAEKKKNLRYVNLFYDYKTPENMIRVEIPQANSRYVFKLVD